MGTPQEVEQLKASLKRAEHVQNELDRHVFHLKTLYDVSRDIYGSVESEVILRNFLLMTMGNFGVMDGFVVLMDGPSEKIIHSVRFGFDGHNLDRLHAAAIRLLRQAEMQSGPPFAVSEFPSPVVKFWLPFRVEAECCGLLGLGAKLINEPFDENDAELLNTLVNNLGIALRNARSFEKIRRLNQDLREKNLQLEDTLMKLKASMRKVEILESIKANLSKFVPTTVTRLIEKSPNGDIFDSREQDVSVLFLDIENYTKICERLGEAEINNVIERHFSVFMDAIYANNGDVNETAGDGLMVLFLNDDPATGALEAVRAALSIREQTVRIADECKVLYRPLEINMGINSGPALVGATKFETYTGPRWTYTARGAVTNVAARIGAHAKSGSILLSNETARRVTGQIELAYLGKFSLKNVTEEVDIYQV
jgi:class 3 adenylate cyclase